MRSPDGRMAFGVWFALPFWSCGPMWFLWLLMVTDFSAVALHRFAPQWVAR
jgi:hypothetical protein